jgi:hypothetical protein
LFILNQISNIGYKRKADSLFNKILDDDDDEDDDDDDALTNPEDANLKIIEKYKDIPIKEDDIKKNQINKIKNKLLAGANVNDISHWVSIYLVYTQYILFIY